MRVVLAHASSQAQQRFQQVLCAVGHDVIVVGTAEEALEHCRAEAPDVAVVDVGLCRSGGELLLEAIKTDVQAYGTAVVLVERPDLDLGAAVEGLRRGVQDFLVEPVSDAELVARVESAGRTKGLQEELIDQARRLETMIVEDSLTGIANRRFILTQLAGMVSGARRHHRPFSVAIIDIDHFKSVNDRWGHQAGDRVLTAVTRALHARLRAEDQLGRLGGEEFLALLPDSDVDAAAAAAEKLRAGVAQDVAVQDGIEIPVTVSVGWAAWEGEEPEDLLHRADEAMYEAKVQGRDRAVGAPASLHRRR